MEDNNSNSKVSTVEEGKTVIDKKPTSQQQGKNSVGEYVDFEEVD